MNVPRIAQKKCSSDAEPFGHAMVNTVCREPIQFRNLDIELTLYSFANIVKREIGAEELRCRTADESLRLRHSAIGLRDTSGFTRTKRILAILVVSAVLIA